MAALIIALLLALSAQAQDPQKQLKSTGSCGRCHVASVLEWSVSKHEKSGTGCVACHGESKGHIIEERNNVKPERIPRDAAISGLCATCHADGCPKSKHKAGCQQCHHAHALLNPNSGKSLQDQRLNETAAKWDNWSASMQEGERLYKQGSWDAAKQAFRRASGQRPEDTRSRARIAACDRRLHPQLPGFEIIGSEFDSETGLPKRVRVAGVAIEMVLIPGGEADIGSDRLSNASPVHTVRVEPFYLAKYEFADGGRAPVVNLSWNDCQTLLAKMNASVPGAGFRLPTEAEWEYAARAGKPFDASSLTRVANFRQSSQADAPQPVGSREPNAWGLYDMLGNVWEWCSSASRPYPYDATDGREEQGGTALRILRGGGAADSADYLDPAMRHSERPDRRFRWNGMRLARSVPR